MVAADEVTQDPDEAIQRAVEVTLSVLASGDVVASLAHAPSTAQHAGGEMATNQTPAQLGTSSISAAAAHYVPGLDDSVTMQPREPRHRRNNRKRKRVLPWRSSCRALPGRGWRRVVVWWW